MTVTYDLSDISLSMANEVRAQIAGLAAQNEKRGPFVAWVYPRKEPNGVIRTRIRGIPLTGETSKKVVQGLRLLGTYAWWIDPKRGDSKLLWALPLDIPLPEGVVTDMIQKEVAQSVCDTQPILSRY